MTDVQSRLINCFKAVFPKLPEDEIPRASLTSVAEWDSVATVSLVSVIEEEFGREIPIEELENMVSFALILDQVQRDEDVS